MKILIYISQFFLICLNHFPNIYLPAVILCVTSALNHMPMQKWASNKAHSSSVYELSSSHFATTIWKQTKNFTWKDNDDSIDTTGNNPRMFDLKKRNISKPNNQGYRVKTACIRIFWQQYTTLHSLTIFIWRLQMNMLVGWFLKTKPIFVREGRKKQPSP